MGRCHRGRELPSIAHRITQNRQAHAAEVDQRAAGASPSATCGSECAVCSHQIRLRTRRQLDHDGLAIGLNRREHAASVPEVRMVLVLALNRVWTTKRELAELIKRDRHVVIIAKSPHITRYASAMRMLLALTLAGISAGHALPSADPSQEPQLQFDVLIDGTPHHLAEGKKTTIKIGGVDHLVTVAVSPFRRFAACGMQFDYPRHANFDHEEDDTESWELEMSNLTVSIHRFNLELDEGMARTYLDATLKAFEYDAKPKSRSLPLGGKTYKGFGAKVTTTDSTIEITMIDIPIDGNSVVMTIENTLTEEGKVTPDSAAAMARIQKTFQLTNK
ncbi:MAG: hypothetical protein ACI89X_003958 [Planctomycetota bacterium]